MTISLSLIPSNEWRLYGHSFSEERERERVVRSVLTLTSIVQSLDTSKYFWPLSTGKLVPVFGM